MSAIKEYGAYAQAALAAYANGLVAESTANVSRYVAPDMMTAAQAAAFDATWTVLRQSTNTIDGFSAVLFQNRVTGQKVLAVAGTDPASPADLITDLVNVFQYGTALGMPQYLSLESFYAQLVSSGMLDASEQITVTGHSLGGFLAQAFTARHTDVVSAAYTYNAPGFGTLESLLGFLGVANVAGASAKITNVHATDGLSMTAGLGTMLGASQPVRIEANANPLINHSVVNLGDALTIYAVYAQLQPSITVAQAATLFVASGTGSRRLEDALDSLRALFVGPSYNDVNGTPTGNRGALFDNLSAMTGTDAFKSLAGKLTVELATATDLAASAKTDFSTFLSLQTLSPIILKTDATGQAILKQANETLAQQWEADQSLTPEQRDAGLETFTNTYLLDRQALLQYRIVANIKDAIANSDGYLAIQGTRPTENNLRFIDIGSAAMLQVDTSRPSPSTAPNQYVIFGNDSANTINGSAQGDRLYGGDGNDGVNGSEGEDYLEGNAGNDAMDGGKGIDTLLGGTGDDTLTGGEASDFLFGGAGNDTYYFEGNIGIDIVQDGDGVGRIVVGAPGFETLNGGNKLAENVWISDDKKFTYALVEGNLVIRPASDSGASGFITVKGWTAGQLGINLSDTPAPTVAPTAIFNGDFVKLTNEAQTQYVLGSDGNYQSAGSAPGALDLIKAGDAGALMRGLGGQDALFGGTGNDVIEGGDGGDALFGNLGSDTIRGGGGVDFIYGSDRGSTTFPLTVQPPPVSPPSDTWIPGFNWTSWSFTTDADGFRQWHYSEDELSIIRQTGDSGNVLEGGAGNDVIVAGTGSDVVHGDADNDNIIGEDGNDVLFGDDGDDRIFGDASYAQHGQDILHGGLGNDLLLGQGNDDAVYGGQGNDTLYGDDRTTSGTPVALRGNDYLDGGEGNDVLYGNEGDDILIGGAGNDVIYGGAGKDIYLFNRGDGIDTIVDTKDGNIFRFGTGVSKDNIKLRLGSLLLDMGNGDQVHIDGFHPNDALNSVSIGTFEFADGSLLTPADLLARGFDIDGSANDDSLTGTSVDDRINGFAGNDILTAGPGSDTLTGGEGSDTFVVNAGAGAVTITDAGALDIIKFGAGISRDALDGIFNAQSMVMTFGGGASVTVAGNASMQFADGATITNLYDASGNPIGSSISREDDYGSLTSFHAGANGTGAKLGDTWTTVLGGHGSDTFNADGSSSGIAYHVDGTYSTYVDDGAGTRMDEAFSSSGLETGDRWAHPDGTWGSDVFYPNGSSAGVIHNADGTYAIYTNDGQGRVQTTTYDATGLVVLGIVDGTHTYPNWAETNFADGNRRVTVEYGPGEAISTILDAEGNQLSDSWTKADGSHGQSRYWGNGGQDSEGVTYRADGTYETFERGPRQTVTRTFTPGGVLSGSSVTQVDGLNSITTFLDAAGAKISETWVHPGGGVGTDIINPLDFNGLPNYGHYTYARDLAYYEEWSTPEGAGGETTFYEDGSFGGSWYLYDESHVDAYAWTNIRSWGEDAQEAYFDFSAVDFGPEDRDYHIYAYSIPLRTADAWDDDIIAEYVFRDYSTGSNIYGKLTRDGLKFLGSATQTPTPGVGVARTPTTTTISGTLGYDVVQDDGLGNVVVTGYNFSGDKLGDMWMHNDGSYGINTYSADGSSTGLSVNPENLFVRFTRDAQGNFTSISYPGATATTHTESYVPPPIVIAPSPPPPRVGAPSGGQAQGGSDTTTNGDGSTTTSWWICEEQVWFDSNGTMVVKAASITDPGYEAAVVYGEGFAGWIYYDTGLPIARYIDDGHGTVESFTYDAQQHVSGRNVAVTAGDGTVTTTKYGAAGHLIGFSVQAHPASDQTNIDSYDAAGRLTGRSEEYFDGYGNSVMSNYDAVGALLTFTTKVVAVSGYQTTFTNYDSAGVATGVIVTATGVNGVIQTDNYDAAGHLTGSVVATPDGAGKVETVNYDASGAIISYFDLEVTEDRTVVLTMHDAQGWMVREDFLQANGLHSNTEYSLDGSSITTTTAVEGSFSALVRDPAGNQTTTQFAADGTKISDAWMRGDGSYGSDTFNADGSTTGIATYADGRTSSSVTVDGEVTTTLRATGGAITGTTVTTHTADETRISAYDAVGVKVSESWRCTDGSNGVRTWEADGSSYETGTYADGSTFEGGDDGAGSTWLDHYDATGTYLGGEWAQPDGTHEVFTQNADGSVVSGTLYEPDGSYEVYVREYLEHAITVWRYSAADVLLETFTNHAPKPYNRIPSTSVQVGTAIDYVIPESAFSDADQGDVLSYSVKQGDGSPLPAWLNFDAVARALTGTPAASDTGDLLVWVTVTDTRGATATNWFTLSITPTRVLPSAIADQTAVEDEGWSLAVPAFVNVVPTETLTYTATLGDGTMLPGWLSFDASTLTFSGIPADGDVGTHSIKVTARDSTGVGASTTFALNVGNVNDAPVVALALALADQSAMEDNPWTYMVPASTFTDPDVDSGDTLTFGATLADGTVLPSWLSFDASTRTFSGTPINGNVGSVDLKVMVTDSAGASADCTFALVVAESNAVPSPTPGSNLLGSTANDILVGGEGNDFLNGLSGADQMIGHQGDDTYTVDNARDAVMELANEGLDIVNSSITYTLPVNVENLVLTGSANRKGTGNVSDNTLVGNTGRNTLAGAEGDDTLNGGPGKDVLIGGPGNDTYLMARGSGADKIKEDDATPGNTDVALFGPDITSDQLWFQHRGRDLQVTVIGTSDKFTISNWLAGNQYHVEQFKTSDGKTLLDSQVQNLVDAMAGFSPPAAGQTTLPPNYQSQLGGVIAANWQ